MDRFAETRVKIQQKLEAVKSEDPSHFGTSRLAAHDNVIAKCEKVLAAMDEQLSKVPPVESVDDTATGKLHSKVLAVVPEMVTA